MVTRSAGLTEINLFYFLRYVRPIWYYAIQSKDSFCYFIDIDKLPHHQKGNLISDPNYKSDIARLYDLSYQAFNKGLISFTQENALAIISSRLPIEDEYLFVSKYFNRFWTFYILMLRIFTLHNPIKEISGLYKSLGTKRMNVYSDNFEYEKKHTKGSPFISIILPTLNRYDHLKNILNDLEAQEYKNFEVLVIDQSFPFQSDFYKSFNLPIRVIHQEVPGLWKARNQGIRSAKGDLIAFTEDDVRIESNWLIEHLSCLETFDVDISAGIFFPQGGQPSLPQRFYHWAEQFASGNALVKKQVFSTVGLFDLQFERMRMGDGEFGMRCYLQGIKSVSNPFAYCEDVKAPEGGLRQMGSWDSLRPTKFFAPRPIPSVNYFMRKYFGSNRTILSLMISLPMSLIPYKLKSNFVLTVMSFVLIFFLFPLYLYQIIAAWKISDRMLAEGSKIEML